MQLALVLTQEKPLEFYVTEKDYIYLNGTTDTVQSDDPDATSYLWARCATKGILNRFQEMQGSENLVGVLTAEGYTIKVKCSQPSADTAITIPPQKWVVFTCYGNGSQGILRTWNQIFTSWMPKSAYELSSLPQLEVYSETEDGYQCEIWIAVNG